jgi:hypothetical protein
LNSLILVKGAKTVPLDLRMVDEHVFFAAVRGDKAEALVIVKPFNGSLCHTNFSLFKRVSLRYTHNQRLHKSDDKIERRKIPDIFDCLMSKYFVRLSGSVTPHATTLDMEAG